MLSFFPRDVLDEIWDLIESVSEGIPSYSYQVSRLYAVELDSQENDKNLMILLIVKGNNFSHCLLLVQLGGEITNRNLVKRLKSTFAVDVTFFSIKFAPAEFIAYVFITFILYNRYGICCDYTIQIPC